MKVAAVRRIDGTDEADLRAFVEIVNAVMPQQPTSLEDLRWADTLFAGGVRFLASLDGRPVGAASVGRIFMYDASFERFWWDVHVLPDARRLGLGGALWAAASEVARAAGKTGFQTDVYESQADGVAFLLSRGFEIVERTKGVSLDQAAALVLEEAHQRRETLYGLRRGRMPA
ncbi:MAG: GNAT family N-acetyltransferase [Chloroflexi bacterium]|nr:GNAT family N-acetyltransferase [Chloroflexota bacterium]